jgi:hypothetical protein
VPTLWTWTIQPSSMQRPWTFRYYVGRWVSCLCMCMCLCLYIHM